MTDIKPTRVKDLETILTLCVACLVFYFLGKHHRLWLLQLALVLGLIGMFSSFLTAKISWAWMTLGEMMGKVMGKVILSLVFFVFLFPIALLSRLFGGSKNPLQLKKPAGDSYYFTRNHRYEAKDLENGW